MPMLDVKLSGFFLLRGFFHPFTSVETCERLEVPRCGGCFKNSNFQLSVSNYVFRSIGLRHNAQRT